MKQWLLRSLLIGVGLYLLVCGAMFALQRQLLYHPGGRDVELDVGRLPGARVELLATADGETLKSWWVPPRSENAAVYLYLHGNAQTLARRAERLAFLAQEGAGVLALSWRGYGGSSGSPSQEGLRRDARAAYEWLAARVDPQRILIFGESLGTALAVELAATHPSAALVLDSPFTSIADVARREYFWLPTDLLLLDRFDSHAFADRVTVPVRIMHCRDDYLVPYELGRELLEAFASTDKDLLTIDGRCHVPNVAPLGQALRELERRVSLR